MAVSEQTPYIEYTANGTTTSFALGFFCENQDHLIVLVDDIEPVVGAWSLSNGAVVFNTAPENNKKITIQRNTPFSRTTEYQSYNNSFRPPAVNKDFDWIWLKLQELGVADWILSNRISALKAYVDDRDDELRAYLMEEIRKQGVALDQLDEYYNYLMQRLAQIAVDKGWDASFVVTASGETQQEVNDYNGAKWRNKAGGYALGATVKLDNGDIVKSTIDGNANDPNVNMTGWFNESRFVEDKTKSFLDFGAKGDGVTDDSTAIGLASTWSSMYKRKVSGLNKEYKCSNVFFDSNCHLVDAKLINNANADLISVLTTTVSRDWLENVTFENIHIDGKRIDQTGVKDTGLAEDGGRHGFRFRRPCRNIRIRKSSANFCASDGICIFPDMFNGGDVVSIIDFVVEDSEFNWNRRHGGSSDRTNGLTLINTKCNFNGRYLEGYESAPQNSGAQGDKPYLQNYYYGNGWDSEEYDNHTYSSNLNFINCEMIDNAKGGLLVLAYSAATAVNENIKILGGKYNKGVLNTQDNNAITITPNGLSNTSYIYDDVVIDSVTTNDNILLRNTQNYVVTNTPCTLLSVEYTKGHTDYVTKSVIKTATSFVRMLDGSPYGTFTYSSDGLTQSVTNLSNVINQFTDTESRKQEFKVGTFKFGEIETTVDSATDSTTWKFKTGSANAERFRVGRYGAQLRVSASIPDSALINESVVFEYVSNTVLKIKMKGSDGIVRSVNLTLA